MKLIYWHKLALKTHTLKKEISLTKKHQKTTWLQRIKRLINPEPSNKEELVELFHRAQTKHIIDVETLAMIEGVLLFSQLRVRDIMLPKQQMTIIPHNAGLDEIITIINDSGHSRFPVMCENKHEVIGILHAKDLLSYRNEDPNAFDITDIARETSYIPESKRLDILLQEFRSNRNHLAIVIDEYGGVTGLITIEDVLEEIVGNIEDEYDNPEGPLIRKLSDGNYIIKALTTISELNDEVGSNFNEKQADTIAGLVMREFGYLPKKSESIDIGNFNFKILKADKRRIYLLQMASR